MWVRPDNEDRRRGPPMPLAARVRPTGSQVSICPDEAVDCGRITPACARKSQPCGQVARVRYRDRRCTALPIQLRLGRPGNQV